MMFVPHLYFTNPSLMAESLPRDKGSLHATLSQFMTNYPDLRKVAMISLQVDHRTVETGRAWSTHDNFRSRVLQWVHFRLRARWLITSFPVCNGLACARERLTCICIMRCYYVSMCKLCIFQAL
ncbi:hypothetical protein XENOCAPTIV_020998 [Xenoophorus captivus]|uniref:Uncharacterized protein n=1 Tax=Xenoophorus captivus TaxID=1517983 RepID=A0ABV0RBQ3_9TELE